MTTNTTNPAATDPLLITFTEAAERLRVSVDTLSRCANAGEIATVRIGRRRLVTPADLDQFVSRQREEVQSHGW